MKSLTKTLYIDAQALVSEKKSGVGVTLEQTLQQLLNLPVIKDWQIYLLVPLGKAKYLKKYQSPNVCVKTIYLPTRGLVALSIFKLMPPIDWFLGKGVYLFPNYRNWPLWHSRSVSYIYDVAYIKHPETVQIRNQKYLNRFMPSWARRTDRVVTISSQVKYEIEKYLGLSELKIDVVACGVDEAVFYRREAGEIEAVKKRYGIISEDYFLFVGNIEPRKNLDKLLDAYEKLPATTQAKYALVFVGGDGWQNDQFYQKLESLQAAKKQVFKISDYVPSADLPALYSGATMLIHPAIYEGFGITPLEAMACGTPVAVSDLPAIREVVQEAGLYFDPADTQTIVSAINTTLTHPDLVAANVKLGLDIASQFSWRQSAKGLLAAVSFEQEQGPQRHPILTRLKFMYQTIDRKILYLLGEHAYPPYVPAYSKTTKQLRNNIFNDFINEQPSRYQALTKKIYLGSKYVVSAALKRAYHLMKAPIHET